MDNWLIAYFTWTDFLLATLLLWGLYLLLHFVQRRIAKTSLLGKWQEPVQYFVYAFLLLYEPFVVLVLTLIFLFIQPALHSVIVILLLLAGFNRIKDYLSGRIILFTPLIAVGKRLRVGKTEGVIAKIGRIGLYLQTGEGLHFINYSRLMTQGYAVVSGREIGGHYQLLLTAPEDETEILRLSFLQDKFLTTPYLDKNYKPELSLTDDQPGHIHARISVREEQHLNELLALLKEWGYSASIAHK